MLARGVPRVPRVRAHWSRRSPTPSLRPVCRAVPPQPRSDRRRRVGHDLGGRAGAARRGRRASGAPVAVRSRGRRARRRRPGAGVRLPRRGGVRHGRHQHRRVPGAGRRARAHAARVASPGCPCGCRHWRSTPSARAAARSARLDPGGALAVGPESAGAEPGPACYGRGGTAADRHRRRRGARRASRPATELPGFGRLDVAAATRARSTARGVSAEGVVAVVDAAMAQRRARGHGRARRRSARSRAGRVRRRRTAPRLCDRRRARHADGRGARRGPACSRRVGSSAHPSSARSCESWPTPASTAPGLDGARGQSWPRGAGRRSSPGR